MQIICTSLQTDNNIDTSSHNFFTGRMLSQPAVSKHWSETNGKEMNRTSNYMKSCKSARKQQLTIYSVCVYYYHNLKIPEMP